MNGLELHLLIYKEDGSDIPDDATLLRDVIEVVERHGFICGGGTRPIDLDAQEKNDGR